METVMVPVGLYCNWSLKKQTKKTNVICPKTQLQETII